MKRNAGGLENCFVCTQIIECGTLCNPVLPGITCQHIDTAVDGADIFCIVQVKLQQLVLTFLFIMIDPSTTRKILRGCGRNKYIAFAMALIETEVKIGAQLGEKMKFIIELYISDQAVGIAFIFAVIQ